MKTRLTHARANVRDLEAAIRWYTGFLGFELSAETPQIVDISVNRMTLSGTKTGYTETNVFTNYVPS